MRLRFQYRDMDAPNDPFDDIIFMSKDLEYLDRSLQNLMGLSENVENSDDFQRSLRTLIEDCEPMIREIAELLDSLCPKSFWLQPQWNSRARDVTNKYRSGLQSYNATLQIGCDIVSLYVYPFASSF